MKALLLSILALAGTLFAETAYINMEAVFNEYYKTVNENIKFEQSRQNFLSGFAVLREEFENTRKEYASAVKDAQNDLLGEEVREAAAKKAQSLGARLQQKQDEIAQFQQQTAAEIEDNQQKATQAIIEILKTQLEKFAADKGYDLVFDVSGKTMNRLPALLVYPKDKEITDAFVKLVNAGHEAEKAENQAKLEKLRKAAADAEKK